MTGDGASAVRSSGRVRALLRDTLVATKWLLAGAGTGLLALICLVLVTAVAALCLIGVGLLLLRPLLMAIRIVANLERSRLRAQGYQVASPYQELPYQPLEVWRVVRQDPAVRRDLAWMAIHGTGGMVLGMFGVQMPVNALRELSFPLWWSRVSPEEASATNGLFFATSWTDAYIIAATAPVWFVLWLGLARRLARLQSKAGRRFLPPHPDVDLSARVAQLTATRAAALDAHAVELRRIERSLHDGTQNRLVGVAVLVGAARQALKRDPVRADAILERAQVSTEDALAELRSVVRSILPPVLEDRGLAGALSALASECAVDCSINVNVSVHCPASVEATAYFAVAEALTNISKHSGASKAGVDVTRFADHLSIRVTDDGAGGADVQAGSGLAGIARRVAAHDGVFEMLSPLGGPTVMEVDLPCA